MTCGHLLYNFGQLDDALCEFWMTLDDFGWLAGDFGLIFEQVMCLDQVPASLVRASCSENNVSGWTNIVFNNCALH